MNHDIKMCLDALAAKNARISKLWRYYDGDHPVVFTNPKWNEVFPNTTPWVENLCQVVCDTPEKRMRIQSVNAENDAPVDELNATWKRALRKTAQPVHLAALVTGHAYIVAWPGKDGKARAYYHDPRQAHVIYHSDDPDTPRVGCKVWCDGEGNERLHFLDLYYPDSIEHYVAKGDSPAANAYLQAGEDAEAFQVNPFGVIPVFHFRLRRTGECGALTAGIISQQDALNKLLNDMMVSSEYSAFAQRWAIGNFDDKSKIPVGPGITTKFPSAAAGDQDTEVGAFPTTTPGNYLEPMDSCRVSIARMSDTPKHFLESTGGAPSGEALAAMESPLIARVLGYEECLAETWANALAFCMLIEKRPVMAEDIDLLWCNPHTVQPQSQASTRLTNVQAGIPIANQLRDEGWTEDDIDKLHEDANVAATATSVPNLTRLPKATTEEGRAAVMDKATSALTAKTAPAAGASLADATAAGVDRMAASGALAATLAKNTGRKVRK